MSTSASIPPPVVAAPPPPVSPVPAALPPPTAAELAMERDKRLVIRHFGVSGIQYASLAFPFLYGLSCLKTRSFSIRNLFMTQAIGIVAVGPLFGSAWGALKTSSISTQTEMKAKIAEMNRQQSDKVRMDDYSVIGAATTALFSLALFKGRAPIPILALGGAGFGVASGTVTALYENYTEGSRGAVVGGVGPKI